MDSALAVRGRLRKRECRLHHLDDSSVCYNEAVRQEGDCTIGNQKGEALQRPLTNTKSRKYTLLQMYNEHHRMSTALSAKRNTSTLFAITKPYIITRKSHQVLTQ